MPAQLHFRRALVFLAILLFLGTPVVSADAPNPIKLNPTLAPNGDVSWFRLSSDGNRVAFLADVETAGQPSIYTVRPDGTGLVQLTAPTGSYWYGLTRFSPDGRRFLFELREADTASYRDHLYSAPAEGPADAVTQLDGAESDIEQFEITPDSRWVLYVSDGDGEGKQLYLVPIEGPASAARRISGPHEEYGYVDSIHVTDDGTRVFWTAFKSMTQVNHLYTRLLHDPNSPIVRLSGDDLAGSGVEGILGNLALSPDGNRVAYIGQTALGRGELFVVPIDGPPSANVKLNQPVVADGGIDGVEWSHTANLLVYSGRVEQNQTTALYTISPDGPPGAAVKISVPIPSGFVALNFRLTGGGWVIYNLPGINSVPVTGTAADSRQIAPASYLYTALSNGLLVYSTSSGAQQIYRVPIVGPLSAAEPLGVRGSFCMSRGGRYTVAWGDGDKQLYRVLTTGGPLVPVSGPMTPGGASLDCAVTPTGAYVVYRADQLVDGQNELFSAHLPVDSPGWDVRLPLLLR